MPKIEMSIDVDAVNLLYWMGIDRSKIKSFHDRWENGGRFISVQAEGWVYSFFNHPRYYHWAKATSSFGSYGFVKAGPGIWAAAACKSGLFGGDRTCYDVCDEFIYCYLGMIFVHTGYSVR